ncbi:MAG: 16S rRNA (cytidine(1402)-2'-O)-methyltransferase [Synergistaceae bacterium]|nr:16S rRNA (cytidine(1402)-2'-O)-methyltransferase [Synergistaceae bacterium]
MPLVIVPTPIGNLEDMTLRGISVLQSADIIACEDTRHTLQLLNHFKIKKPLISCHEHNEAARIETLMKRIENGETVALVSDAGTPGLSDPGGVIIKAAIERGLPYDVLPGANALLPALLLSGMDMESFMFVGFLKGKAEEKRRRLREVSDVKEPLVFYVSPHKLLRELEIMGELLGDREAALVREISKIHQESIRGTLLSFKDILTEDKLRGEYVCVVSGKPVDQNICGELEWMGEADMMLGMDKSVKDIANLLSIKYCIQRNRIKRYLIEKDAEEVK